ncbi:Kynureninase 2 [Alternaria gaisen]|uniref:Kynureninase 2 n=1 Tax=Alternaria gaisen TaxID=167740 RepID=A0ACB6FJ04_9PLEO|nr:Kynureninase 2 [Alternaria gaisen]
MDAAAAIKQLRQGQKPQWPANAESLEFAHSLDQSAEIPKTFRPEFVVPSKAQLKRKTLKDDAQTANPASTPDDEAIYFCGNSLGLQPKAVGEHLNAYLKTWGSIAVGGHFTALEDSPLTPYQDMAAGCSKRMADIVGASPSEIVAMNTLTINLHLMMAAFYKPTEKKHKIMCEWRPFPSDWYAIESQIEWHGLDPKKSMLLVEPDDGYIMTTKNILRLIDENVDELALIMLPGIQYYSGQLLDIPTITAHARKHNITIGWDLAHAAGNAELKLHDWDVDFACWCTYKYMNAGAGSIAGAFIHEKHGNNDHYKGLKGWYGHDKSSRFLMDNKFVPTPGAQGFQCSNPSIVDLTCLAGSLSVFEKTSMADLRSRSLLLTAYAEHLLSQIAARNIKDGAFPFQIITPTDPRFRGAQLSVLLPEDVFDDASAALVEGGVICDKRKPGIIRVAPVPMYNTFNDVWSVLKSGAYSDLTITCNNDTYKVHKAIVCERAEFFARNLKFGGKESVSGIINLPDDEPDTIRLLIHYLYGGEYKPLLPDNNCWAGVTLSAFKQAAKESRPLDNANSQPYSYDFPHTCSHPNRACTKPHICPHHTCSNNKDCKTGSHLYTCSNFNCEECNPSALPLSSINGKADQLLLHSEMYEIADKYDVVGLKDLVIEKFHRACQHFWDSDKFSVAAHHVFSTTLDDDKGLRDIVSATISAHMGLIKKPEVKVLLNEFNGLALGILEEKIIEHGW